MFSFNRLAAVVLILLAGVGTAAASWGDFVDPNGDCELRETEKQISISVPAGVHELWYAYKEPAKRFTAPRLLREVEGDFAARVRVTANWTASEGVFARAAGLVIWDSPKQYFRHERCQFGGTATVRNACFTTPIYDLNDQRQNRVTGGDPSVFGGGTTWLMLQRTGQTINTWTSKDGESWKHTAKIKTQLPKKVLVGIDAINRSEEPFAATYEKLLIWKP